MTPGNALWIVNGLGGQFEQTIDLDGLKGYVKDREGEGPYKAYLGADYCEQLAEAFAVLAAALRARVDFDEEEPDQDGAT